MTLPPIVPPKLPSVATVKRKRSISRALAPTEHAIQAGFIQWATLPAVAAKYPDIELGFAVPNGGHRSKRTAAILKSEGVRPGVPDWLLPSARGGYAGLALEFKRPGQGVLSTAQRQYIDRLTGAGWLVHVTDNIVGAIASVTAYLQMPYTLSSEKRS